MKNHILRFLLIINLVMIPHIGHTSSIIQITLEGSTGFLISPDGTKISFRGYINGNFGLYIMDLNSKSFILVPDQAGYVITSMNYNGERVVVSDPGIGESYARIYQVDYLTKEVTGPIFTVYRYGFFCDIPMACATDPYLTICSDGERVVFLDDVEYCCGPEYPILEEHLYVSDFNGENMIDLGSTSGSLIAPIISGNCNWIVFNRYPSYLYIVSTNGGVQNYLTSGFVPSIDYTGSKIVFARKENNIWGTYLINSDGSGFRKILSPGGGIITQNGERIVYSVSDENDPDIYRMDIISGDIETITNNSWNDYLGSSSFDGRKIVFQSKSSETSIYNTFLYIDAGETKTGDYVAVDMAWGVVMIYTHVFLDGRTRMEVDDQGPELPPGFTPGSPQTYYHISTTAGYEGEVLLCITYDETAFGGEERVLHLLHSHGMLGDWQDITVILDTEQNQICGLTSDLSDFAIAKGPEWPSYEPPPPSGPSLSSTDDDDSSCGSLPGSSGASSGIILAFLSSLLLSLRLRKLGRGK